MEDIFEWLQDQLGSFLLLLVLKRLRLGISIAIILFIVVILWRIGNQIKPARSNSSSYNYTPCLNMSKVPTLRMGSKGKAVEVMQRRLSDLGYSTTIDGEFGKATQQAVVNFQNSRGLRLDGVVGDRTWIGLFKQC
ncbi:peptidoglycan-binding domain-containing protein [Nostoc sp. DedQUE07]|uniref:peptidoglycan-binding domain-containing protein n=1 Tax=Nostoc sp. DedQUE07 TaxID=3075392 RepID=UPI002AD41DDA|nr:peptidoglycan-binding domain-containing protein [Nostoc sp. DedQUE07]MDZ8127458.1 peptidoglycan-binding domain-containing protein [Nostoc sp. DedQUE07]